LAAGALAAFAVEAFFVAAFVVVAFGFTAAFTAVAFFAAAALVAATVGSIITPFAALGDGAAVHFQVSLSSTQELPVIALPYGAVSLTVSPFEFSKRARPLVLLSVSFVCGA